MMKRLIAEVSVKPSTVGDGFDWCVFAPGLPGDQAVGNDKTPTLATWRAVEALDGVDGVIGVMSPDGTQVAYTTSSAVPQYEFLQWQSTVVQKADAPLAATRLMSLMMKVV